MVCKQEHVEHILYTCLSFLFGLPAVGNIRYVYYNYFLFDIFLTYIYEYYVLMSQYGIVKVDIPCLFQY